MLLTSPPPEDIVQRTMQNGEDSIVEDFDLFWGIGPSHNNNDSSSGDHHANAPASHTLNPNLMGGLWAHGDSSLESYGHRHHVHAPVDAINEGGVGVASSPSSRRSAWLPTPSPPSCIGDNFGASNATLAPPQLANAENRTIPTDLELRPNGSKDNAVDSKLEELAAAISLSLANKLEPGVRGALLGQRHFQQNQHDGVGVSQYSSPQDRAHLEGTTRRVVETATAPLQSRITALEEQVSELRAAIERNTRVTVDPRESERSTQQHSRGMGRTSRPDAIPRDHNDVPLPQSSRGLQQGGKGGGGNRGGSGGRCGSGGGTGAPSLEESIAALSQRTGTLEGRHKQVQAKVALLDNAFGSKASDWAQTLKSILAEREKGGGGGVGRGGGGRSANKSGKKSVSTSSHAAQARIAGGIKGCGVSSGSTRCGDDCGDSAKDSSGAPQQHHEGGVASGTALAVAAATLNTGGGAIRGGRGGRDRDISSSGGYSIEERHTVDEGSDSVPSTVLPNVSANTITTSSDENAASVSTKKGNSAPVEVAMKETTSTPGVKISPLVGSSLASDRCARCAETEKRCAKLEARVSEWEQALLGFQKEVSVAAANAQAAFGAVQAAESAPAAAERDKVEAGGGACRPDKVPGNANWASKSSVEKLASDLRQLSERARDGEDALALVDHGLKGVRDEVWSDVPVVNKFFFCVA